MSRGNEKRRIVLDDADRVTRLAWLEKTVRKHGWLLHAFALMPNHEHLFVTTPEPDLSAGMLFLNGSYATYFNRRHERVGHLFQGRFKALIVDTDCYGLRLSRYIHLNPFVAGMVSMPEEYLWSSYPGYYWSKRAVPWVSYSLVIDRFGGDETKARRAYRKFVEGGMAMEPLDPFSEAVESAILGSDDFVARIRAKLSSRPPDEAVPQLARLRNRPVLQDIAAAVAVEFDTDPSQWQTGRRVDGEARAAAAYLAKVCFGYSPTVIAAGLGYSGPSSISHAVRRIRRKASAACNAKIERLAAKWGQSLNSE
jgi:REP element-mobilizing transposase RayT